jgi:peroxiredoxin
VVVFVAAHYIYSSPAILAEKKEKSLVGEETLYFSLPSTQDRLISYLNEYYGKHHLIITFFPAAFTHL